MNPLEGTLKAGTRATSSAFREGQRSERKKHIKQLKRIHALTEWEARLSIEDYINHLGRLE